MEKLNVLAVGEVKKIATKAGGTFDVQDLETVVYEEDGSITVGALPVPRELVGKVVPGTYHGQFKWERNYKNGRLEKVLKGLLAFVEPSKTIAGSAAPKAS